MTIPETMKAVIASAPGGPEVLEIRSVPVPKPGPGEVVIRVAAAGVNGPDLAQRRGDYPAPEGHSPLLGLEVSGEIAIAAGDWAVGDRVVALTNGGGYAEYVAVPAGQVLPAPDNWSLTEAAALPETWFTVTQTVVMRAGLADGQSLLVTGAAGGLGLAAMQIAQILGATPIAIVGDEQKAAYVRDMGIGAIIRHDTEDVVARTRELTGGRGASIILDMLGGDATARHIDAAARGGHIVMVATLAGREATLALNKLVARQLTISGSTLRHQSTATKAAIAARLRGRLWPALSDPSLPHPKVATFPLGRAAEAHARMEERGHYGKIVLVTDFGTR